MAFAVVFNVRLRWFLAAKNHICIFTKVKHLRFLSFDCLVHFFTYPPVTGTSHQLHNLKLYISVHIGSNELVEPRVTFYMRLNSRGGKKVRLNWICCVVGTRVLSNVDRPSRCQASHCRAHVVRAPQDQQRHRQLLTRHPVFQVKRPESRHQTWLWSRFFRST